VVNTPTKWIQVNTFFHPTCSCIVTSILPALIPCSQLHDDRVETLHLTFKQYCRSSSTSYYNLAYIKSNEQNIRFLTGHEMHVFEKHKVQNYVIIVKGSLMLQWNRKKQQSTCLKKTNKQASKETKSLSSLIIYMKKFLHSDWLRAVQSFFKTVQKRVNSVKNEETNQAFWLVNDQRNSQMANQTFCFQIKRKPWMAQLTA